MLQKSAQKSPHVFFFCLSKSSFSGDYLFVHKHEKHILIRQKMGCGCNSHGKSGKAVRITLPYDQCTTCAKKHIVKAWSLFNEFNYADANRDALTGQLRLAVDHLMFVHQDIAQMARQLAIIIEENRDAELTNEWDELLNAIREAYKSDHEGWAERLENLKRK